MMKYTLMLYSDTPLISLNEDISTDNETGARSWTSTTSLTLLLCYARLGESRTMKSQAALLDGIWRSKNA